MGQSWVHHMNWKGLPDRIHRCWRPGSVRSRTRKVHHSWKMAAKSDGRSSSWKERRMMRRVAPGRLGRRCSRCCPGSASWRERRSWSQAPRVTAGSCSRLEHHSWRRDELACHSCWMGEPAWVDRTWTRVELGVRVLRSFATAAKISADRSCSRDDAIVVSWAVRRIGWDDWAARHS